MTYIKFLLDESGAKETLEWLSSDIFGKVVQIKKGVTIDRDRTSINLNENMDSLVPASKISDLPTGWICGQVARERVLYANFLCVNQDIKDMVKDVLKYKVKK